MRHLGNPSPLVLLSLLAICVQNADAQISGRVTDQSRAAIPDALVRLTDSSGKTQDTKTLRDGDFQFLQTSTGKLTLSVQKDGFEQWQETVTAPGRKEIGVELKLLEVSSQVTVTDQIDSVGIDSTANTDTTRMNVEDLQTLPVLDRDAIGLLSEFLDPGSSGPDGGDIIVDGLDATGERISPSMIQEVKVNNNPYSAEFSRPGRGRVEIRTKSGTERYHGRVLALLRDSNLDARNPLAETRAQQQRRAFEGTLTGPVRKGSSTRFLLGFERENDKLQSLIYAQTPSGELRQNFPTPEVDWAWNGRLYYNLGTKHNLVSGYQYSKESLAAENVGGFNLPELAVMAAESEHRFFQSISSVFTPSLLGELSLRVERDAESSIAVNPNRLIDVQGAFSSGGAQIDQRERAWDFRLSQILSWTKGKHFVRAGVQVPRLSRTRLSNFNNFGGTYTFATLDDYNAGNPLYYSIQQGNGLLPFWAANVSGFIQDEWRIRPDLLLSAGVRWDWLNAVPDSNNFAPRISLAWSPGDRKTVIRAGIGIFYDRMRTSTYSDTLLYDGVRLRQILVQNPSWPNPPSGSGSDVLPPNIVRFSQGIRMPYLVQHGFTIERQVGNIGNFSLAYIGTRGVSLLRSRDANAPLPGSSIRPDSTVGVLQTIESAATLKRYAVEFNWNARLSRYFTGKVTYRLASARNNTGGAEWFPANSHTFAGEWARADFDARHSFRMMGTAKVGRFFDLGIAMRALSGRPYSITTGHDDNNDGRTDDRPPGVDRNTAKGPGAYLLDVRWSKEMTFLDDRLDGGLRMRITVDAFNILNHTNYSEIVGNQSSSFFEQPISARPARRLQLGLQFSF